ncbi:MAG: hypothetical protein WC798_00800 [Candidatus Paceibacterota bacterium]|jgi:hypothetical protein
MALPSNIPTSFVPRSAVAPRKFRAELTSVFDFLAYGILAIVFALAIGVFLYGRVLASSQSSKDAALAQAEESIDLATVESFVRLRDRLTLGKTLLANHVAFSEFFSFFETLMPASVRFVSLHLSADGLGGVKLEGSGVAKSFNALAAASTAFARDGRIKNAIFSNITVNQKDSSVSFALSASLDQKTIAFSPSAENRASGGSAANTFQATSTATSTKQTP